MGGILNGKYHGKGRLSKPNDEFYEGFFKEGLKHGEGRLKNSEGLYEGFFEEDLKHGRGKIQYYND